MVSQSFIAFGDILELHKKFLELSGGINRVFELEELLQTSQSSKFSVHCKFYSIFFFWMRDSREKPDYKGLDLYKRGFLHCKY